MPVGLWSAEFWGRPVPPAVGLSLGRPVFVPMRTRRWEENKCVFKFPHASENLMRVISSRDRVTAGYSKLLSCNFKMNACKQIYVFS